MLFFIFGVLPLVLGGMSINREQVLIVGSGPAAFSAAVYVKASGRYSPLVLEGEWDSAQYPGGQLMTTTEVDNFPGFCGKVTGPELIESFREHLRKKEIRVEGEHVVSLKKDGQVFRAECRSGGTHEGKAVIIATGAVAKRLSAKGCSEKEFWQKGISACAVCDGWLFRGKDVAVIGGGDTAMEEVLYLSKVARKVYLCHRSNKFRARPDMLRRVRDRKNVEVRESRVLEEAKGDVCLSSIVVKDPEGGAEEEIAVEGMFFAIGHTPASSFLPPEVMVDEHGHIVTSPLTMETTLEGAFACGDVQDKLYRQAITAAASGGLAGKSSVKYLDSLYFCESTCSFRQ
jgi:thioredoxin reductase (NADPH)